MPRPKIATEVLEARGSFKRNPSHRPKNPIKGAAGDPDPPEIILNDKDAHAVWSETVDVLRSCNILSKTDTHLLTTYCLTYSEWLKVSKHVSNFGHADENGKTSPQSVAFFKLSAQHHKLMNELGLSPAARARLSVAKNDSADKEEEASIASLLKSMKG